MDRRDPQAFLSGYLLTCVKATFLSWFLGIHTGITEDSSHEAAAGEHITTGGHAYLTWGLSQKAEKGIARERAAHR